MRFNGLLNPKLISEIAGIGHADVVVIVDAGFPISKCQNSIDLSIVPGLPSFLQVCEAIAKEMPIEGVVIAKETEENNPAVYSKLEELTKKWSDTNTKIPGKSPFSLKKIPNTEFKEVAKNAKLIIRTVEFTPYANIAIHSGCAY